jgi:hypothetical protein
MLTLLDGRFARALSLMKTRKRRRKMTWKSVTEEGSAGATSPKSSWMKKILI